MAQYGGAPPPPKGPKYADMMLSFLYSDSPTRKQTERGRVDTSV